jgi:predicted ferric reductase
VAETGLAIERTDPVGIAGVSLRRPQFWHVVARLFWLAVLVNTVVVVWLWYRNGGTSSVHGLGDLWTTLGRITGLLGAYFLLIQVLLLARLPWLAGFDRMTVWHRRNGKLCLYLVLAHVVFITIGYAAADRLSILSEASTLLNSYPGMLAATIGTGLMIVTVITSLVIVRRRLRYEAWYLVHFTGYAGIGLAWFHQIPTGNELVLNPAAATYWTALYLATLALLVLYRVVQPIVRGFTHQLRVAEVTSEGPGVVSVRITGRRLDRLPARAGQFFLWRFRSASRWWEAHPFSLSAAPDGRSLRITAKNLGNFTSRLGEIEPGTLISAEGPFGEFTDSARRSDRAVLIAGGIGITPIRALMEQMVGDLVVVYRVIKEEDAIFGEELGALARDRGFRLIYVFGDHAAPGGERLLSAEHLRELVPDITERDVYVCGPPGMTRIIEKNVRRAAVPRRQIHIERFAL